MVRYFLTHFWDVQIRLIGNFIAVGTIADS